MNYNWPIINIFQCSFWYILTCISTCEITIIKTANILIIPTSFFVFYNPSFLISLSFAGYRFLIGIFFFSSTLKMLLYHEQVHIVSNKKSFVIIIIPLFLFSLVTFKTFPLYWHWAFQWSFKNMCLLPFAFVEFVTLSVVSLDL